MEIVRGSLDRVVKTAICSPATAARPRCSSDNRRDAITNTRTARPAFMSSPRSKAPASRQAKTERRRTAEEWTIAGYAEALEDLREAHAHGDCRTPHEQIVPPGAGQSEPIPNPHRCTRLFLHLGQDGSPGGSNGITTPSTAVGSIWRNDDLAVLGRNVDRRHLPTGKSSSSKSPHGRLIAMPITPKPTGSSRPMTPASNCEASNPTF